MANFTCSGLNLYVYVFLCVRDRDTNRYKSCSLDFIILMFHYSDKCMKEMRRSPSQVEELFRIKARCLDLMLLFIGEVLI